MELMEELQIKKSLMGGEIEFRFYGLPSGIAEEIAALSHLEGKRLEKIFNFYDSKSELNQLNKNRKAKLSLELLEVLKKALEFSELTNGAYDVGLGKNYLERKKGLALSQLGCSYKDIKVTGEEVEFLNKDLVIDLGSLAKGYIVDKLVEFIAKNGVENFLVDARGDLRIFGDNEETIDVQHPREKNKVIYNFKLNNQALATSGDYNQYVGDYDHSHVVGKKEIISASVIAPTLMEADVFATCLMVLSRDKREKLIKDFPQYKVLLIDNNLKIYKTGVA